MHQTHQNPELEPRPATVSASWPTREGKLDERGGLLLHFAGAISRSDRSSMFDLLLPQLDSYPPPPMPCPWDPVASAGDYPGVLQLASSDVYPGCESDSNICMHSGYYGNDGEGHASTFVDPAGCNPTYQSCAELRVGDAGTTMSLVDVDPAADDFVWQKGYAWCAITPEASSGCAVYNAQAGGEELAVLPTMPAVGPAAAAKEPEASRPGPGHLLLCGHALLFGVVMATVKEGDWQANFEADSAAAADSMTPVGGTDRSLCSFLFCILSSRIVVFCRRHRFVSTAVVPTELTYDCMQDMC